MDDEVDIRSILRKFLEDKGIEVLEANDGAQCVEIAKNTLLDLIFLDVMMPNINGFEAQKEIYKMQPKKRTRKKTGHRQPYTEVEITKIG